MSISFSVYLAFISTLSLSLSWGVRRVVSPVRLHYLCMFACRSRQQRSQTVVFLLLGYFGRPVERGWIAVHLLQRSLVVNEGTKLSIVSQIFPDHSSEAPRHQLFRCSEDNPVVPRRRLRPTWRLDIPEEETPEKAGCDCCPPT